MPKSLPYEVADLKRQIAQIKKGQRLAHGASIENAAITVNDGTGGLRAIVGVQGDGTVGVQPVNAPPPPQPTPPVVASVLGGVSAGWNGQFAGGAILPMDWSRIEVHASQASGFEPLPETLRSTIETAQGATVVIPTELPVYVRLVARNTSGTASVPSAQVGPVGPSPVVATDLLDGIVSTLKLAEDAVTEAKIAASAVSTQKIAAGAVQTNQLAAGSVVAEKIASAAVTTAKLEALSVTADKIAANAVTAGKILAGTIDASHIKALAITSTQLAANSVTAGKIAAGAIETPHIAVGAIRPEQIGVGQGTNLVPDPGFESAATANVIVAAGAPWSLAPGNRNGVGVKVDCTADVTTSFTLPLANVPVLSRVQLWLGVDILVAENLNASGVKILARWEDSDGTILGYGVAETTTPLTGRWQRITGQVAAPQGTTNAVICLEASNATAGWVVYDNAVAIAVFGHATGGARAEVGPQGMRLYDETGEESVSLVTGGAQYLTLRAAGTPVATVDTLGNGSFADLNVAGDLTVNGDPVGSLLGNHARGIVAVDYMALAATGGTSELGYVELGFDVEPDRMYRIVFHAHANPSAAGGELQIRLRDGGAAKPTITSPQLQQTVHPMALGGAQRVALELVRSSPFLGVGTHRLLITFKTQNGPAGQTVDLYGTNTTPGEFYVEDIGGYIPETGGYNNGGGTAPDPVRNYTKTYTASWSGSYAKRARYNSYYGNTCVQGYYSANHGTQAALIGFPAALATDLAGATIRKAEVYLYAEHWYYASGGKAVIKAHSHASRPATFSSDAEAKTVSWSRNQGKWVDITSVFDSTTWRGIALDPNTTNREFYGKFRGAGQTYPPKLRVSYSK